MTASQLDTEECVRILLVDGYPIKVIVPIDHPLNSLSFAEHLAVREVIAEEIREFRCMNLVILRPANASLDVIL